MDCKRPYEMPPTRYATMRPNVLRVWPISLRESRLSQVFPFRPLSGDLNRAKLSDDPVKIPPTRAVCRTGTVALSDPVRTFLYPRES